VASSSSSPAGAGSTTMRLAHSSDSGLVDMRGEKKLPRQLRSHVVMPQLHVAKQQPSDAWLTQDPDAPANEVTCARAGVDRCVGEQWVPEAGGPLMSQRHQHTENVVLPRRSHPTPTPSSHRHVDALCPWGLAQHGGLLEGGGARLAQLTRHGRARLARQHLTAATVGRGTPQRVSR
jgi:hypothetical protein